MWGAGSFPPGWALRMAPGMAPQEGACRYLSRVRGCPRWPEMPSQSPHLERACGPWGVSAELPPLQCPWLRRALWAAGSGLWAEVRLAGDALPFPESLTPPSMAVVGFGVHAGAEVCSPLLQQFLTPSLPETGPQGPSSVHSPRPCPCRLLPTWLVSGQDQLQTPICPVRGFQSQH